MAEQFEPQKVDLSDVPEWLRQSRALILRRLSLFCLLTAAYLLVSWYTRNMGALTLPLGYVVTLFFLVVFVATAKVADESQRLTLEDIIKLLVKIAPAMLFCAVVVSLITLATFVLGTLLEPVIPGAVASAEGVPAQLINWIAPGVMRFFVVYTAITIAGMWFLLPLLAFLPLSMLDAAKLSKRAERINVLVIVCVAYVPLLTLAVLLLLHDLSFIILAVAVPFFGAVQYVSWRHVFTHKKDNLPARALSRVLSSLPA